MAEPKKKIIIKKKKAVVKKPAVAKAAQDPETEGLPEDTPAPKLKTAVKKKVQVTKKKTVIKPAKEAPPPEVVSTSEIDAEQPSAVSQKTMITKPPIGAPSHEDEPEEEKKSEAFKFYCIRCGQKLEAYYDWVGRSIGCPRCKARIKIPEPLP